MRAIRLTRDSGICPNDGTGTDVPVNIRTRGIVCTVRVVSEYFNKCVTTGRLFQIDNRNRITGTVKVELLHNGTTRKRTREFDSVIIDESLKDCIKSQGCTIYHFVIKGTGSSSQELVRTDRLADGNRNGDECFLANRDIINWRQYHRRSMYEYLNRSGTRAQSTDTTTFDDNLVKSRFTW